MKSRIPGQHRFATLAAILAVGAVTPALRADWGSIRANNHAVQHHEVVRAQHEVEHGRAVVEPRHVVVAPGHTEVVRAPAPRHMDFEAERRHGFYWGGYHPGITIGTLPAGYVQVSVGGVGYCYYDGVYFQPTPQGPYAVVFPPIGVVVPQLPEGAEVVMTPSGAYYYAAGAFYQQVPNGFLVVPAPPGATVNGLPPGSIPVAINGRVYYQAGSTYFLPVMAGGVTVYVTARP